MKQLKFHLIVTGLAVIWGLQSFGARVLTLPGGLMFPAFSTSGLVNASALAMDWRAELKALYAPPLDETYPHAYSGSIGYSTGMIGLNAGYLGSLQENTAFNSAFLAGAFRFKRLALGASLRKPEFRNEDPITTDLSASFALSYRIRVGASLYNIGNEPQLGLGIGLGRPQQLTLAADLLFPVDPQGDGISDQYAIGISMTRTFENVAYSAGLKFNRQQDGFVNESTFEGNLGLAFVLNRHMNFTTLYHSNPHTITFGLAWVWTPPAEKYIREFQGQNRKTIWD